MYRAVLPTLVPSAGWIDPGVTGQGCGEFRSPPQPWSQRADSYSGPTRAPGSIVEVTQSGGGGKAGSGVWRGHVEVEWGKNLTHSLRKA